MSRKNLWDDEPFRDSPNEFVNGQWVEAETYTPAPENTLKRPTAKLQEPTEEELAEFAVEDIVEQVSQDDEDEDDFTDVLSDARLRLEQGKLYELIMNHDLFSDVEADPRAAKTVQRQIKKWARDQMEIMLGMKQEVSVDQNIVSSPFNDMEVSILKKLASAASRGATESEEANETIPTGPSKPPKKNTLNTINSVSSKTRPVSKPIQKKVDPIQRSKQPQPKKAQSPKNDNDYVPLKAPASMISDEERIERNKQAAERQEGLKATMPKDRVPYPDEATQEAMAMAQAARATSPGRSNLSGLIFNNLKNAGKI